MEVVNTQAWSVPSVSTCDASLVLVDVLTKDGAGQYAAYRCIADEGVVAPDLCAAKGAKLRFIEAKASFPFLDESEYRR